MNLLNRCTTSFFYSEGEKSIELLQDLFVKKKKDSFVCLISVGKITCIAINSLQPIEL